MSAKINNIPAGASYEGYVWMSDQTKPDIINGAMAEVKLTPESNPFIIESRLYDTVKHVSYSVKYVDGEYKAFRYDLDEMLKEKDIEIEPKRYLPHRMDSVKGLHFLRFWRGENDPLCEDMKVLQPGELVFVGFQKFKGGNKI